jgi:hypothetical protein
MSQTDSVQTPEQKSADAANLAPLVGATAIPGQPDPKASNADLEKTKPQVVAALRSIVSQVARQTSVARRLQIQRVGKAEMYWEGRQHIWWNDSDGKFMDSSQVGVVLGGESDDNQSRFSFTKNFYSPFGEAFIAALTQMVPKVPFRPVDPNNEDDIRASRAASDAAEYLARVNDPKKLMRRMGYHGYTGSLLAAHVRWVTDGNQFGWDDNAQLSFGTVPGSDSTMPQQSAVTGTTSSKVPKGQVMITIHGAAEINTPIWANEQEEFSYLNWQIEVPRSLAKSTFPWAAEGISSTGQITADDSYARLYRTAVRENLEALIPSDALEDLVTLNRVWLRPHTFEDVADLEVRNTLKTMFPAGCYVCFAGSTYCESKSEGMDEVWRVKHCLEGEGQARRACGEAFLDLQDAINTLFNLAMEYLEEGIPMTFHGSETLNKDAVEDIRSLVGLFMPCKEPKAGENLDSKFYTPTQLRMPPELMELMEQLAGQDGQFITGMFPALFGGAAKGAGGDTASGYEMQRNQAMGRLVAIYDQIKLLYQEAMLLAVRQHAKYSRNDITLQQKNPAQKPRTINLSTIKKGNFTTYPEPDEAFPLLYSEKRATLEKLMGMAPDAPELAAVFQLPANQSYLKAVEGLTELVLPGEDARDKQLREIEQLLGEPPVQYVPEAGLFVSSMPPEPLDYDDFEIQECDRYINSDVGQEARYSNVEGYQNIVAHRFMHVEAKALKQKLIAAMTATTIPAAAAASANGRPRLSAPSPDRPNGAAGQAPPNQAPQAPPNPGGALQ